MNETRGTQMGRLDIAGYVAAATNLVATIAMATLLRPGLPSLSGTVAERIAYVQTHVIEWRLGWVTWNIAAISLVGFFVALRLALPAGGGALGRLAVLCAVAGLAGDLASETFMMGFQTSSSAAGFPDVERGALLLTGYLGNGLYSVCGSLLTWSLRATLPRRLLILAIPLWVAGFSLSAATLVDWRAGEIACTAILMPLFILWAFSVGRWARHAS